MKPNCTLLLSLLMMFAAGYSLAQAQGNPAQQPHPLYRPGKKIQLPNSLCNQAAKEAQNAPSGTTTNCYWAITLDGTQTNPHPKCYYHISAAIQDLSGWLADTKPAVTVLLPFKDKSVTPITGWMYNPEARHNAVDYGMNYVTFPVNAVADGKVIWVGFMPSPGNVVIIEHTPPTRGGTVFRTIYHHLRNGRDNDIAFARATMKSSAMYGYNWQTAKNEAGALYISDYQKLADKHAQILAGNPTPEQLAQIEARWGTNEQTLQVKEGDKVKAGQQIGWAGTTGFDTGGVHLHIMFARPAVHSTAPNSKEIRWTLFDPYGLYQEPLSCYTVANPSGNGPGQHPSFFNFKYKFPGLSPTGN